MRRSDGTEQSHMWMMSALEYGLQADASVAGALGRTRFEGQRRMLAMIGDVPQDWPTEHSVGSVRKRRG